MNLKKLLGKRLQEIRRNKKITQEQLAEYIGVEPISISNIEVGRYYSTAENLEKILKVLDTRPSDLFLFEQHATHDELIDEMLEAMKKDEKLTRQMYKFFMAIKY